MYGEHAVRGWMGTGWIKIVIGPGTDGGGTKFIGTDGDGDKYLFPRIYLTQTLAVRRVRAKKKE